MGTCWIFRRVYGWPAGKANMSLFLDFGRAPVSGTELVPLLGMERRIDRCLKIVRGWAQSKIATGLEPPWAWYQYMKLVETVDAIEVGRESVTRLAADSPRPASREGAAPPREAGVVELDRPRRRPKKREPPLPM